MRLKKTGRDIWIFYITGVSIFIFSLYLFVHPVSSYDSWFHLFFGKYVLTNHSIPRIETFVFTVKGVNWYPWQWLSSVIFYSVYSLAGLKGLIYFTAVIGALSIFLLYYVGWRIFGISPGLIFLIIMPLIYIYADFIVSRGFIFSVLMFIVLIIVLESRIKRFTKLAFIFLLFALWSNLHPGVYIGLLVLLIYSIFKKDYLISLSGFTSIWLNPLFFKYYYIPLDFALKRSYLSEFAKKVIAEYYPVYNFRWHTHATTFLFFVTLLTGLVYLFVKRKITVYSTIFFLLAVMGILFSRFIIFAEVFTIIFIFSVIKEKKNCCEKMVSFSFVILPLMFGLLFTRGIYLRPDVIRKPRTGILEDTFPVDGVNFLKKIGYEGRMFNPYEMGHYLEFRGYSPFIDGRTDTYTRQLLKDYIQILSNAEGYEDIVQRCNLNCFILNRKHLSLVSISDINDRLWQDKDWFLAYWDDLVLIYLRRDEFPNLEEYINFNPELFEKNPEVFLKNPEFIEEVLRKWREDPDCFTVYYTLARYNLMKGEVWVAKDFLLQGLDRKVNTPLERAIILNTLGSIYYNHGEKAKALKYFKTALRTRFNEVSNYLIARYYLDSGRPFLAKYRLRLALWQNPFFTPARTLLNSI